MIKFTASGNGITIVGLGLEHGNLDRLKDGQPIRVKLSDLGFVGATGAIQIMIFAGKDAVSMQRDLSQFIGPDTVVNRE
jgi:hypothetical protein